MEEFRLDGANAVVTGGTRGLGRGIAEGLLRAGARVCVAGRDGERAAQAATELGEFGRAVGLRCDVRNPDELAELFSRAREELGPVEVLVNSAGVNLRKPAVEYTAEDWDYVVDTNLKGTFFACTAFARALLAEGRAGSIVNMASLASARSLPTNIPPYVASKGGVALLTKSLAGEWAPHGVRVNAVGPGYFLTDMTRPLLEDPERRDVLLSRIPMGRFGEPRDLVGTIVFLASRASSYVTGQVIYVDGGYLTR
jgi:NAD(P)-dependent dehydrogenase (short-subunit alcohol dehydrogenase family)